MARQLDHCFAYLLNRELLRAADSAGKLLADITADRDRLRAEVRRLEAGLLDHQARVSRERDGKLLPPADFKATQAAQPTPSSPGGSTA